MTHARSRAPSRVRLPAILGHWLPASQLARVLALGGVSIVAAAAAVAAIFVISLHDSELSAIRNRLEIPARAMADVAQQLLHNSDLALQDIQAEAERVDDLTHPTAALRRLLVERATDRPLVSRIDLYDARGAVAASSLPDMPTEPSAGGTDFFKRQIAAQGNQLNLSALLADPRDGTPTIVASRPLFDKSGQPRGVAALFIKADLIQRLFASLPMPPGSTITLFNADGRLLVRSPPLALDDELRAVDFSQRAAFRAFRSGGSEVIFARVTTIGGIDRFIAGIGGKTPGFVVTSGWDVAAALAHWRKVAAVIVAGTAIGMAIIVALFVHVLAALRRNEILLAEVSQSDEKFRTLMAALPDAVMIIDSSLKINFANGAAEKLFGYEPGEMNGLPLQRLMISDNRSRDEQNLLNLFAATTLGAGAQGLARVAVRKDGSELPVEINARAYESPEGRRLVSALRDVSRREANDRALRRSRENLARAQQLAGIGSFERDLVTGERELSDEFKRIWGIDDNLSGRVREFLTPRIHPDDRQKFHEMRDAAYEGRPTPSWDLRVTHRNGEERIVHPEFRVIFDDNGTPVRMFGTVQDVTERKKIENELRRSREKLARAQRIAGIGNFERDLTTGEIEWSEEFMRIWGLTTMPAHGASELLLSLVHPEDREKFVEGRAAALQRKLVHALDFRITCPDGEERILHREYGVQFDDAGKAIRMFGTVQDVTERKRIEIELRRSRENLFRAQRIAALGSFERDLVTNKAEWSDEMYRILGVEKSGDVATYDTFIERIHPDDRARIGAAIVGEMKGIRVGALECRIVRPDGAERIVRRESDVVVEPAGRPVRVFGTVQDITELKKTELELRRSQENLARAQSFARMGSFERDLVTGEGEWSEEMYRLLGLDRRGGTPDYNTMMTLVHPEDRKLFQAFRDEEIAGAASSQPLEYRIVRPDGVERIVRRESAVVFDEENRPIRLHGTLRDVTEQRVAERRESDLERQLLHSQKLEALGTLAGGIAHDLNNTLVPIMALSKVTARRFEAGSIVRANLETIYEASERARDLVKRVVAFSRRDESEMRDIDIAEIVDEALKLLRATIPSSITLEAHLAKVPLIPADASQIHQVVTNLVSNASQAIGSDIGTITVTLEARDQAPDRGEICLSVGDTGIGMDKATQQRIFEPFFTTKPVGQGTGLGLSIVHGIVAGHGGHIEVTSAPGKGTRFALYFPVRPAKASVTSSRPAA